MDYIHIKNPAPKPADWPCNAFERKLDEIAQALTKFWKDQSYLNREELISCVSCVDLNQHDVEGIFRVTDYEIQLIDLLRFKANIIGCVIINNYLYDYVMQKARIQKRFPMVLGDDFVVKFRKFEFASLYLHYIAYYDFISNSIKSYAICLMDATSEFLLNIQAMNVSDEERQRGIQNLTKSYVCLLHDISYCTSYKRMWIWKFTHQEIFQLLKLASKLIDLAGDTPAKSPLRGTMYILVSALILKSRNNYNSELIYKYMPESAVFASRENHQIWMKELQGLNDPREKKVIPELFAEKDWQKYSWIENISFVSSRDYFVSSFSKTKCDKRMMEEYGSCIFGFKDDRAGYLMAPMYLREVDKRIGKEICFSQVISFDVIYDRDEAKNELIFLCDVINLFSMTDEEKHKFLTEIIQYWVLSVKDQEWEYENEHRYVVFMYSLGYPYRDVRFEDGVFKTTTSLFSHPDFILGTQPTRDFIQKNLDEKRSRCVKKSYIRCDDCLNCDFDNVYTGATKCAICDSERITRVDC